jgi:toxin-antitoxin system PIN domain toxin
VRALLDVNILMALLQPDHVHHRPAHAWWDTESNKGWASCPLTENAFVRILSQPGYPRRMPISKAVHALNDQKAQTDHAFWPDRISIVDPAIFDHRALLGSNQLTDAYLLALAVENGGRLVTFDRPIGIAAVRRAEPRHLLVL